MPTISDFRWWIKKGEIGIGEESDTTGDMSAPGADVVIRYAGPRYPDDFTDDNVQQESEIPPQLHRALAAHVLMSHFEEEGDDRAAARWEKVWKRLVRQGNAIAFREKQVGAIIPKPQDY